jgi:hypothetical protein
VSVPAPPYGSFAPPPSPVRNGLGIVTFTLGLMVAFGLVVYAAWLAVAALAGVGGAIGVNTHGVATQSATVPPVAARPVAATPSGATMAFNQLWTSSDGNTIVAGAPTVGTSAQTGGPVIRVAVTLTNNGERDWNPVSTSFVGRLNRAPVPESTEGDWMYSTPIIAHTSVTLTKVFVAGPGQFSVSMATPQGVALFTGQV